MRPVKILFTLRECAGWSESSLGTHIRRYTFSRSSSYYYTASVNINNVESNSDESNCPICSKFSDKQAYANSVDPDQTPQNAASDQGLHCLPPIQQFLEASILAEIV